MSESPFFKRCPKSGRIVGLGRQIPFRKLLWPILGLMALAWFCARTFTKPSRLSYPCQQAAAPIAAGFVFWLAGLFASAKLFRASKTLWREQKLAASMALLGAVAVLVAMGSINGMQPRAQTDGTTTGRFVAKDKPNSPIGVARGIMPGRVSWIRDPNAIHYNGTGSWPEDSNFNQGLLDNMLRRVVISVPGGTDLRKSWDSLFISNNRSRGRGARGYTPGEMIAIKINLNDDGSTKLIDQTPQLVKSLLRQLVDTLGVEQSDILLYDARRLSGAGTLKRICRPEFPKVRYNKISHPDGDWVDTLKFSDPKIDKSADFMPRWVAEADYLINFAVLKRHTTPETPWTDEVGQAGISVTGKNHFGSLRDCVPLHPFIRDWYTGDKTYNAVVDLMSGEILHDKTVLYLVDALFTGDKHNSGLVKWKMAPFNGNYPASVFAGQDQVAIESVSLDFLNAEMGLPANADNFLHEAALIGNPPSKTKYVNRGKDTSMGVHEHWNNPVDKKYSRNLGTGKGIELFTVPAQDGPAKSKS